MKLWIKFSIMTTAVLFLAAGISGAVLLWNSACYNEEKTLENFEQQVLSCAGYRQETFGDDRITVTVDAKIIVPDAEGFRTKKVTSRIFTQEDYDTVNQVLLGGGALWNRDQTEMGASNGFTKEEINERIAQLGAEKAAGVSGSGIYGGKEISYDEEIAEWKEIPEAAPDEIRQKAEELVNQLGLAEFSFYGEEYLATFSSDERLGGDLTQENLGYGIRFSRMIGGIPVTYTRRDGTGTEGDWPSWPYEDLTVIYDENGVVNFSWTDPYLLEDLSGDYVFLLSFSDIQEVARKMMLKKYEGTFQELAGKQNIQIDEVRLGYMRIMEKGNPKEGTMVPVWDFFGTRTVGMTGQEESYSDGGPYESWLTINAMDATVIDRDLGY